ncbi:hypothetical protein BD311DRAFT_755342 [Dichomitus squalens]|uniref:Uncharacterized protein n=1 Tax=Dichomitus squalens TaxID=114155 RepID=A0A4Q9MUM1_9APHY|nr:hypothetical protein BD311DRAFT_755342 [Dichomitus squalens]
MHPIRFLTNDWTAQLSRWLPRSPTDHRPSPSTWCRPCVPAPRIPSAKPDGELFPS